MSPGSYDGPRAIEQAVKARIKRLCIQNQDVDPTQAFKVWIFHRFLARVYLQEGAGWILKGGTANLVRVRGSRMTRDIDLQVRETKLEDAIDELVEIAALEVGDYLSFSYEGKTPILGDKVQVGVRGFRLTFAVRLGQKKLQPLLVDLTADDDSVLDVVELRSDSLIELPGIPQPKFWVVTLESQIAEKCAALIQTFDGAPSSRGKDLFDVVIAVSQFSLERRKFSKVFDATIVRRGIDVPERLIAYQKLRQPYDAIATKVRGKNALLDFERAVEVFNLFVFPQVEVPQSATWNPQTLNWEN